MSPSRRLPDAVGLGGHLHQSWPAFARHDERVAALLEPPPQRVRKASSGEGHQRHEQKFTWLSASVT